jgi:hypothetical protein
MKLLLDDEYAPLTSRVAFLEAPLEAIVRVRAEDLRDRTEIGFGELLRMLDHGRGSIGVFLPPEADPDEVFARSPERRPIPDAVFTPVNQPFPEVLRRLEPLVCPGGNLQLLLATDSEWTACFDNGVAGAQFVGVVTGMVERLRCRGLLVTCIPHTLPARLQDGRGRYGAVQFHLFAPDSGRFLNYLRTVDAIHDGDRWFFEADGHVQPFEQPERYGERRIRDRFTPEMLEDYCAALGVRYFDPSFYCPPGCLIELRQLAEDDRTMSLREAQWQLGIRD